MKKDFSWNSKGIDELSKPQDTDLGKDLTTI
jgi:hypothetical protein